MPEATTSGSLPCTPLHFLTVLTSPISQLPPYTQDLERGTESAPSSPALKAASEARHAVSLMPQALDLVRAVFGLQGPVVKSREEVRGG